MKSRPPPPGKLQLERALSRLGAATRSQARRLIGEGRVRVNGVTETCPEAAINPRMDRLELDGRLLRAPEFALIACNKPRGVLTTRSDPRGRATIFDVLENLPGGVQAVGRLDQASTGLLLLTTHTRLAAWLTDPVHAIPREYIVTCRGELNEEGAAAMMAGVEEGGEWLSAVHVERLKTSRRESHARVVLNEGKNREIRRIFLALGHEVTRLKRIRFGGVTLGDLEPGRWRVIPREDIPALFPGAETVLEGE
ncbi:MAG: Ribosomal large subunit pseudouridine synthase B [Myxococcota bacterium]|nr:Ribosomal large subunit pseudouridine synthase B [Myxococcota bacterium]